MKIHYLQHVFFEHPGSILSWAERKGHTVTKTLLFASEKLPETFDFDWLIVMGGPMNVYEEEKFPFLAAEKAFIRKAIENGKTVLGFCLGAQLIADIIGGKVVKNKDKEIGWFPVRLTEKARKSPLFSFFPPEPTVFQWHGDTFIDLPEDVEIIASSVACDHQAFVYRGRVFGFQYHLENTLPLLEGLIENCRDEIVPGDYVLTPEEILSRIDYIEQDNLWMEQFLDALSEHQA